MLLSTLGGNSIALLVLGGSRGIGLLVVLLAPTTLLLQSLFDGSGQ